MLDCWAYWVINALPSYRVTAMVYGTAVQVTVVGVWNCRSLQCSCVLHAAVPPNQRRTGDD